MSVSTSQPVLMGRVNVLDDVTQFDAVLHDAEEERRQLGLPAEAEVWIYAPPELSVSGGTSCVIIKRVR